MLLKWNKNFSCYDDDDDDDDYDGEMKWVLNYINIMKIIQGKVNAQEKQQQQDYYVHLKLWFKNVIIKFTKHFQKETA